MAVLPQGMVAWSWSRIGAYETCPKQFYHVSVAKDFPFEESQQMKDGKIAHEAFASFLRGRDVHLPLHLRHHEPFFTKIKNAPGEKVIEQQIALNHNYQMTDWFAKDAWLRVISDLTILNGNQAVVFDWKTGKQKDDFTQLKLTAATTFLIAPEIETIRVAYYWTKTKAAPSETIHRPQVGDVWSEILPRVQRYQDAHVQQNFPARPNPFCKGCVVKTCPYWEARR